MSNSIAEFVKRMASQGRTLKVNGNFVVISPAAGLSIADMLEMQKLNKTGEMADYVNKISKGASQ